MPFMASFGNQNHELDIYFQGSPKSRGIDWANTLTSLTMLPRTKPPIINQIFSFFSSKQISSKKLTAFATVNQWKERTKASSCDGRLSWFQKVILWNFAFVSQEFEISSDWSEAFLFLRLFFPITKPACQKSLDV